MASKLVASKLPKLFSIQLALTDDADKMGSQEIHFEMQSRGLDKLDHLKAVYTYRLSNESETQILARIHKWEKEVDSSSEAQDLIDHWMSVMDELSSFSVKVDIISRETVGVFHD